MTGSRRAGRWGLALALLAGMPFLDAARADDAGRYAYLFLQGKLSLSRRDRLEGGVKVRVTSKDRTFEATTDDRGVFVFERLPVTAYDLQIVTPDGKGMRSIRAFNDPRGIRLEIKTGKGAGKTLHLDPTEAEGKVTFAVPERAPDWGKFWKEFGIVLGVAGLFAL
jgi:hypothetical protein